MKTANIAECKIYSPLKRLIHFKGQSRNVATTIEITTTIEIIISIVVDNEFQT